MPIHTRTKCEDERTDCFAYRDGNCRILDNGLFKKSCPFYKSEIDFEADRVAYPYLTVEERSLRDG